ncbi:MAG: recombinase family protein, partial [Oscillospiraceae bacterium]
AIEFLTDTGSLDKQLCNLESERDNAAELLRKCIDENAHAEISKEEYETKFAALAEKYEIFKGKYEDIKEKIFQRKLKATRIETFFKALETSDIITEFDESLWNATVDIMTVYSRQNIVLKLKDGTEIKWSL